jgi:hypothetical protein
MQKAAIVFLIGFLYVCSAAVSAGIYGLSSGSQLITVDPSTASVTVLSPPILNELVVSY